MNEECNYRHQTCLVQMVSGANWTQIHSLFHLWIHVCLFTDQKRYDKVKGDMVKRLLTQSSTNIVYDNLQIIRRPIITEEIPNGFPISVQTCINGWHSYWYCAYMKKDGNGLDTWTKYLLTLTILFKYADKLIFSALYSTIMIPHIDLLLSKWQNRLRFPI